MSEDIRLSVGFWSHPKTIKLQRRLGVEGVLALLRLWTWTGQSRPSGALTGMDAEDIEIAAGWQGEAQKLAAAFEELRWIDREGDDYAIHGWDEHQPWVSGADARKEKARTAANVRWEQSRKIKEQCLDNAPSMGKHCGEHIQAMPSSFPFPSNPEEKKKTKTKDSSPLTPRKRGAPRMAITYTPSFEEFWHVYPRPVGKDKAFESWRKIQDKHPEAKVGGIIAAIKAQVEANQFLGADGVTDFIPLPATWLNQARWADPVRPKRRGTGSRVTDQNARAAQEFVDMVAGGGTHAGQ